MKPRVDLSGAIHSGLRWIRSLEREGVVIRQSALFLCLLTMVLLASLIISCGGTSNSMVSVKPGCTGQLNVVGDWQGSLFSGNHIGGNVAGTIDSSGNAVFFDNLADILVMNPITGTCSFSATATVYSSIENGIRVTSSTATGNVNSATSISGTLSGNPMTLSAYNPMGTGSPQPISGSTIAVIEGQRQDQLLLALSSSNGNINFSGTDVNGCSFSGGFAPAGASDLYVATLVVFGSGCVQAQILGPGFESDSDLLGVNGNATGTYLYGVLFININTPFVMEIVPPTASDSLRHAVRPRGTNSFSRTSRGGWPTLSGGFPLLDGRRLSVLSSNG